MAATPKPRPSAPARYRALTRLEYPADERVIARLLKGEAIPMDERGDVYIVNPGVIAEGLPACSVPWLLEQGLIEPVDGDA